VILKANLKAASFHFQALEPGAVNTGLNTVQPAPPYHLGGALQRPLLEPLAPLPTVQIDSPNHAVRALYDDVLGGLGVGVYLDGLRAAPQGEFESKV
jgi:hypothetical protein